MVPPDSRRISRVLRYSGATRKVNRFRIQGCHLLWPAFPDRSTNDLLGNFHMSGPTTPSKQALMVWAFPRSLAATSGISIDFFSWGYLDVSVLPVGRDVPMNSVRS